MSKIPPSLRRDMGSTDNRERGGDREDSRPVEIMADHITMQKGLHDAGFEQAIGATYIGQAHIAGTSPEGRTCRECRFWHTLKRVDNGPLLDERLAA